MLIAASATLASAQEAPKPIVGFAVRGKTKLRESTARILSQTNIGDRVSSKDIPRLQQAYLTSELFTKVEVTLEDAPDGSGVIVVVTVEDKHSWIVAPTLYVLPGNRAFGVGFAENNFQGRNKKVLVYGQVGTRDSLFFGTLLDPSLDGTQLTYRLDLYAYRRDIAEFENPTNDAQDASIARTTTTDYIGGGFLVGWRFTWWLTADLRFRGAWVDFKRTYLDDDAETPQPIPEVDGWDVTMQPRLTLDARQYRFGVSWGPYLQIIGDASIPGMDDYDYSSVLMRAFYSWRLFSRHQVEIRTGFGVGRNMPLHEEFTLGGASDLRGYSVERFRGDRRMFGRLEYSVPLLDWKIFAFRGIGFWDTGAIGFHQPRASRAYLATQADGMDRWRNDVGAGLRIYVKNIVLPLLGLDVGYGIEGRSPKIYFAVGLTNF